MSGLSLAGTRPTRDGVVVLLGALGLGGVAMISGNNLLYLVAAPVWAVLLLSLPLGAGNLRGISVRRALPAELYAGRDAPGELLVRTSRWGWGGCALELIDEGTGARGQVRYIAPRVVGPVAVRWRFGERGPARLSAVIVRSSFPFGFLEHTRRLPLSAEILIYPRPLPSVASSLSTRGLGLDDEGRGGSGDLVELRAFLPGDSLRRIHWPTTARVGSWVVAERGQEQATAIEIEVRAHATGPAWERELSRACGEIQRALASGLRVGLQLPELPEHAAQRLPPSSGGDWRRTLLDALARLPRIGP